MSNKLTFLMKWKFFEKFLRLPEQFPLSMIQQPISLQALLGKEITIEQGAH